MAMVGWVGGVAVLAAAAGLGCSDDSGGAAGDTAADSNDAVEASDVDTAEPDTAEPDTVQPETVPSPECGTLAITAPVVSGPPADFVFSVDGSFQDGSTPSREDWTIIAEPSRSRASLVGGGNLGPVTAKPVVVGHYLVGVDIASATSSCHLEVGIDVRPGKGLYFQLLWDTPGDPDPFDSSGGTSVGSDLDLHLLHSRDALPFGSDDRSFLTGGDWGAPGAANDAYLGWEEHEGTGPEYIVLEEPEPDATYVAAVYDSDDWGYGPSTATLDVYLDGELLDQWESTELVTDDFWMGLAVSGDGKVERIEPMEIIHGLRAGLTTP